MRERDLNDMSSLERRWFFHTGCLAGSHQAFCLQTPLALAQAMHVYATRNSWAKRCSAVWFC